MEILGRALEEIPGLALVFAIVALLALKSDSELAAAIRVFVVAWVLYRISKTLDPLFDFLYRHYEPPNRSTGGTQEKHPWWQRVRMAVAEYWYWLRKKLRTYKCLEWRRKKTARLINKGQVKGVYDKAKEICEKTKQWKKDVQPWNNDSKAARTFIVPLFLITIVMSVPGLQWEFPPRLHPFIELAKNTPLLSAFVDDFDCAQSNLRVFIHWAIPGVLCLICIYLYFRWRIKHLMEIYKLAAKIPPGAG